jgi:predicted phage terminase large subunit-like protein
MKPFIHLKLKAIATEDEWFRNAGDALWPERYSVEQLEKQKIKVSNYWFNGMYQQEPTTKGSEFININKFNKYIETEEHLICHEKKLEIRKIFTQKYGVVDLAISQKVTADYTAQINFRVDSYSNIFIEKVMRERLPPEKHEEIMISRFYDYGLAGIGIESVQYQETLIQRLLAKSIPVISLKPEADKLVRLMAMLPFLNEGKIYLKENQIWENDFLNELAQFPFATHDDQVDAFSYISQFLTMQQKVQIASSGKTKKKEKYRGY